MAKKTARARARASAIGFSGDKKLKKKSFLVIVAPQGTTFKTTNPRTKVDTVERLGASAMPFDIIKQELNPAFNPTRILLSIRGTKDRSKKAGPKKLLDPPDPGDLTITLTDVPATIDPVVTVPVEFVDDFDP